MISTTRKFTREPSLRSDREIRGVACGRESTEKNSRTVFSEAEDYQFEYVPCDAGHSAVRCESIGGCRDYGHRTLLLDQGQVRILYEHLKLRIQLV